VVGAEPRAVGVGTIPAVPITESLIRELAGLKGERAPVVSCYLDVDGRRFHRPHDYEVHLDAMMRRARRQLSDASAPDRGVEALVEADLRRIESYVRGGIDRSHTRGLAVFACSASEVWRVIELPVPVRNRVVLNHTPYVRELESVIERYERFAVLLADRQRARLFLFELGQLVERQEQFDQLPRHDDDGGEWTKDHLAGHTAAAVSRHLKRAAAAAFAFYRDQGFDHLIVGAPEGIAGDLERELHPYLRERIAARLPVAVAARDDEIRAAALAVEDQVARSRQATAVERLRQAVGSGGPGVAGLAPVLRALVARRVHTLLVSEGYEEPGWRCRSCAYIGVRGRGCPVCNAEMDQVDDVIEEAVEEGLAQSCRLEMCRDNADLDVLGRVGALLRF
jgi:peptide chain release factor subunit 1